MIHVLILYASSTGNTEEIANLLEQHLDPEVCTVTMENIEMDRLDPQQLLQYDGILFGTYTYDDGDLPFETELFCDTLRTADLTGKVVGVFGSGDTAYDGFCSAVDLMKVEFKQQNARVIQHSVKVDLSPDEEEELLSIKKLAEEFQQTIIKYGATNEAGQF
ncbi:flavodoxin domain-containing protein [Planococcus sp. ISL-110]|uniref:flavodoxin domain-containing protein n=1 Tax=Planococcus sp. ISL-110 TaxID=2819167 RepID=UPI001BEAF0DD|nr:flavodoxin domain-containing protein [Planococcus sp. ISL-110]MBT2569556.1 flavodoxin domain-containing protein [Planococcus sp. ISL-110]